MGGVLSRAVFFFGKYEVIYGLCSPLPKLDAYFRRNPGRVFLQLWVGGHAVSDDWVCAIPKMKGSPYCWMDEILHHQKDGWNILKTYTSCDVYHLSTGAGFRNRPQYDMFQRVIDVLVILSLILPGMSIFISTLNDRYMYLHIYIIYIYIHIYVYIYIYKWSTDSCRVQLYTYT